MKINQNFKKKRKTIKEYGFRGTKGELYCVLLALKELYFIWMGFCKKNI